MVSDQVAREQSLADVLASPISLIDPDVAAVDGKWELQKRIGMWVWLRDATCRTGGEGSHEGGKDAACVAGSEHCALG